MRKLEFSKRFLIGVVVYFLMLTTIMLIMYGGNNNHSGQIQLNGKDKTDDAGGVFLVADNNSNKSFVYLLPNGTFKLNIGGAESNIICAGNMADNLIRRVFLSDVQPAGIQNGDFWYKPTSGEILVYDGTIYHDWVILNAGMNAQAIYDVSHPIGDTMIRFNGQPPVVPAGVVATWTDISSTYENRYFKVSSSAAGGTSEEESLPKPNVNGDGKHHHDMYSTWTPTVGTSGFGVFAGSGAAAGAGITYDAGLHSHSITTSGPYKDGSVPVKPLTTTIKVFERTA